MRTLVLIGDGSDRVTEVAVVGTPSRDVRKNVEVVRATRVARVERAGPVVALVDINNEVRATAEPGSREEKRGAG